jgi:hypothetical protein
VSARACDNNHQPTGARRTAIGRHLEVITITSDLDVVKRRLFLLIDDHEIKQIHYSQTITYIIFGTDVSSTSNEDLANSIVVLTEGNMQSSPAALMTHTA